jgi:twitching motility two-component system response regulator PilH
MAKILIVDDSPTHTTTTKKILIAAGYDVITAINGNDGIVMAKAEQPDLVLMDVVMPELNGFQATRKLTQDPVTKHIPVILLTTKDQQTDRVWGERQGAKDYLVKPPTQASLIAAIEALL